MNRTFSSGIRWYAILEYILDDLISLPNETGTATGFISTLFVESHSLFYQIHVICNNVTDLKFVKVLECIGIHLVALLGSRYLNISI